MLGGNDNVIPGERNAASSATCSRESAERLAAAWPIAFANHEKACAEGIVSERCLGCSDVNPIVRSGWCSFSKSPASVTIPMWLLLHHTCRARALCRLEINTYPVVFNNVVVIALL